MDKDSGPPVAASTLPRRPRPVAPCCFCSSPMHYSRSGQTLQCASASCGHTVRVQPRPITDREHRADLLRDAIRDQRGNPWGSVGAAMGLERELEALEQEEDED